MGGVGGVGVLMGGREGGRVDGQAIRVYRCIEEEAVVIALDGCLRSVHAMS